MKKFSDFLNEMGYGEAKDFLKSLDSSFPSDINPEILKYFRRKLSLEHHPDRGGRLETMQKINDALDALEKKRPSELEGDWPDEYHDERESHRREWEDYFRRPRGRNEDPYFVPRRAGTAVWSWAGYSGGMPADDKIWNDNDINAFKKRIWEKAGSPKFPTKKDEYRLWKFDGNYNKSIIAVFSKSDQLKEVSELLSGWWGTGAKAVVITGGRIGKGETLVFLPNHKEELRLSHNSFNSNPFNSPEYINELKKILSQP